MSSAPAPGQWARYQRQIAVLGEAHQRCLMRARLMVIGLGGLGNPAATMLCLSGVRALLINDCDIVELSNLSRQPLYREDDIMSPKAEVAARRLGGLRADLEIEAIDGALDEPALAAHMQGVDAVLDCTDNFESRFAINRAAHRSRTPLISASALAMGGQLAVFDFRDPDSACYQCLFPKLDDEESDCSRAGILAPVLGVMAAMQVSETIKLLGAKSPSPVARFWRYSAIDHSLAASAIEADAACAVCRAPAPALSEAASAR